LWGATLRGIVKIGLYGGSFDPVHFGHLLAAQAVCEGFGLDRVVFIPAAQAPLKAQAVSASGEARLAMLRAATAGDARFSVSDVELRRGGLSYSLETVRAFQAEHPGDTFYWIMGGDQVERLAQWRRVEELAAAVEFIAVDRPGCEAVLAGAVAQPPVAGLRLHRMQGRQFDMSSTELRERARLGLPLDYFLPHKALVYLNAHCLYRET